MMVEALARLLSTSALAGTRASLTLLCLGLAARMGVLEAPLPKAAPMSAPLPCCISTSPIKAMAMST